MESSLGEKVYFNNAVIVTDSVEQWLGQLSNEMRNCLQSLLLECLSNFDLEKFPEQILCLAEVVMFTLQAEKHIQRSKHAYFQDHFA